MQNSRLWHVYKYWNWNIWHVISIEHVYLCRCLFVKRELFYISKEQLLCSIHSAWFTTCVFLRDLSEISRGRGGRDRGRVTTFWDSRKGRSHEKWAVIRGRILKICVRDHVEAHPQNKKEVLYFVKKPGRNRRVEWSAVRIRVGLLMLSSKMYVYGITKNRLEIYFELS